MRRRLTKGSDRPPRPRTRLPRTRRSRSRIISVRSTDSGRPDVPDRDAATGTVSAAATTYASSSGDRKSYRDGSPRGPRSSGSCSSREAKNSGSGRTRRGAVTRCAARLAGCWNWLGHLAQLRGARSAPKPWCATELVRRLPRSNEFSATRRGRCMHIVTLRCKRDLVEGRGPRAEGRGFEVAYRWCARRPAFQRIGARPGHGPSTEGWIPIGLGHGRRSSGVPEAMAIPADGSTQRRHLSWANRPGAGPPWGGRVADQHTAGVGVGAVSGSCSMARDKAGIPGDIARRAADRRPPSFDHSDWPRLERACAGCGGAGCRGAE